MKTGALFSECRTYRYGLWRTWQPGPYAMFIGLNPSTADETKDDPTIRRCIAFAKAWGYSGLYMANLFAFRATDPREMKKAFSPVGPSNDHHLVRIAEDAGVVIAAWGQHGTHLNRDKAVRSLVPGLHYLRLTKEGHPGHPLYLPGDLKPQVWHG